MIYLKNTIEISQRYECENHTDTHTENECFTSNCSIRNEKMLIAD